MYIQIKTFMYAVTSHKMERAKYHTEKPNSNSGQEVQLQVKLPVKKKTLTVDTDEQTFTCDNANGHSQTGNRKELASRIIIQKTS